jgi:PAS domain S-box-containing protein
VQRDFDEHSFEIMELNMAQLQQMVAQRTQELFKVNQALRQEIEQRKKAESWLKESEERFRSVAENSIVGIAIIDEERRAVYVNREFCQRSGYSYDELIGSDVSFMLAEESVLMALDRFQRRQQGESVPDHYEVHFLRKDGQKRLGEVKSTVYRDLHGKTNTLFQVMDITDKRAAEASLALSEEKYRTIIENMHDVIYVYAVDFSMVYVSPNVKQYGYSSEEVVNFHILQYVHPDDQAMVMGTAARSVSQGESASIVFRVFTKAGDIRIVEDNARAVRDANGSITCVIGVLRDITERKKAEDALVLAVQQLNDIIDFLPDATFVINTDKKVISWNRAMEEMTGVKKEEMIGQGDHKYTIPFYGQRRKQLLDLIDMTDEELEAKYKFVKRIGRTLYAEAYAPALYGGKGAYIFMAGTPLFDTHGRRVGAIESIRDITDRKDIEEKYRNIFENALDGIYQTTMEGRFLSVNPAFARMLGYDSPEELISSVEDIARRIYVQPELRSEYLRILMEFGVVHNYEAEFFRKDGSRIWGALTARIVRDADGRIRYLEGIAKDITERKLLEKQFFESQKIEAIGTLAGGVAHDFNNILGAIIGYTELAISEDQKEIKEQHLHQALKGAERAKDLVRQILTFSRKESHEKKPLDLKLLLKEAIKFLRASIPSTIEIRQHLTKESCDILADPTHMHQIIMNLCSNATHAMKRTGGVLNIELSNVEMVSGRLPMLNDLKPGHYANLTISDTGHGIDPGLQHRIFDPFFTTKSREEGTGLGLSVVYGIVKAHNGTINFYSETDKGATFNIYLPLIIHSETTKKADKSKPVTGGTERILFVDDEPALVALGTRMLSTIGYEVTGVTSSVDALHLIINEPQRFDLVITDMTLPKMTGIVLARKILKVRPGIPIILCSGTREQETEEKAKSLGIKAYLTKPLSVRELSRVIRDTLDGHEQNIS